MERGQEGRKPGFEEKTEMFGMIYEDYLNQVYGYFYVRTGDIPLTQELTSQTMERALNSFISKDIKPIPDIENSYGPWFFTIARRVFKNHQRDIRRLGKHHQPTSLDEAVERWGEAARIEAVFPQQFPSPEQEVIKIEEQEKLLKAIRQLPEHYQDLLIFRFTLGLPNKEIGKYMGISEGAVKSLYQRVLMKLRKIMMEES